MRRFQFWKVFWIVLAVYLLFALIGIIAVSITPVPANEFDWNDLLSWKSILNHITSFLFIVAYYYFSLNAYYKLIYDKKPTINFIRLSVVIVLVLIAYYILSYYLFTPSEKVQKQLTPGLLLFSYSLGSFFYLGVSLSLAYIIYLRDEKKQRKILEAQKMQLEVEKSQANFNFLKAQINPHFLHNTLNFLYSKSLPYSPELSEGILTLSDIMRYALSEGNARDGKAPLKDEIEHVRNVIKIQQLRFSNQLNVQFDVEGVINGATIVPFVLITLVENAFKHGDLKSTDHPICIKVKVDSKRLYFYCKNKKKAGPKELSTGIGLDNIRKRLELAYGPQHTFTVKEEAETYTTELIIDPL
jgi:two-component system LytT family sensor kinase